MGGEEFTILFPETGVDIALQVANRLREALATTVIDTGNGTLQLTASIELSKQHSDKPVEEFVKEGTWRFILPSKVVEIRCGALGKGRINSQTSP